MCCKKIIEDYLKNNINELLSSSILTEYDMSFNESGSEFIDAFDHESFFKNTLERADNSFADMHLNGKNIDDAIVSILTSNRYSRRGSTSKEDRKKLYATIYNQINTQIKNGERIKLIIPGFTTKAHNPLRVYARKLPDLAEVASLVRLYEICYQINKIYPPGAEVVIITDGVVYAKLFGETEHLAKLHYQSLQEWVHKLNIQDTVKLVDLSALLPKDFPDTFSTEANQLKNEWSSKEITEYLTEFIANTKNLVNYDYEIIALIQDLYLFGMAHSDHVFDRDTINRSIIKKAFETSFKYEAFLNATYKLNVIGNSFPEHIRCTGRPKTSQLGIHMIHEKSYNFPWNGVGVLLLNGRVDVYFEKTVMFSSMYRPVFIKDETTPFYYRELKRS